LDQHFFGEFFGETSNCGEVSFLLEKGYYIIIILQKVSCFLGEKKSPK
jgi:hypothetical protein